MKADVQFYFNTNNLLRVIITDPDEYNENAENIHLDFSYFIYNYYNLIIELLDNKK